LSVLIRYTNSDYPFGILKLFSPLPIFPEKSKQLVSLIRHVSWTIWVVGLPRNSYKHITNTAWFHDRLCKITKRVHSTRSRKW